MDRKLTFLNRTSTISSKNFKLSQMDHSDIRNDPFVLLEIFYFHLNYLRYNKKYLMRKKNYMKLLTFNTHSLEEANMPAKQQAFADFVLKEMPDIIALQEVNQSMAADEVPASDLPAGLQGANASIPFRTDNHALAVARILEAQKAGYYALWLPMKVGYDKYDEGMAIFSRKPILETKVIPISRTRDYHNYRTRDLLAVRTEDGWFGGIHASWWSDPDEPFKAQWPAIQKAFQGETPAFLMGDFNGDASVRNETYDLVAESGWLDTFVHAKDKDAGWTIEGTIDGWKHQEAVPNRRIDQIWMNHNRPVLSSRVIFNGKNEPVLSDHFGVMTVVE